MRKNAWAGRSFDDMRQFHLMRIGWVGAALLLASTVSASENPIAFATRGGDAWSFHKSVDIVVFRSTLRSRRDYLAFDKLGAVVGARARSRAARARARR